MAPAGRPPKPHNLRIVEGNRGKRPIPESTVEPNIRIPTVPAHLCDVAKVEWGRVVHELHNLGLISNLDRAMLAAYCASYALWVQATEAIKDEATRNPKTRGLTITTTNGNVIQNPMVGTANKAATDMLRFATEFGMTPSARARIGSIGEGKKDADKSSKYM
jgi:P27 family predicted phage terminase small subunit